MLGWHLLVRNVGVEANVVGLGRLEKRSGVLDAILT